MKSRRLPHQWPMARDGLTAAAHRFGPCQAKEGVTPQRKSMAWNRKPSFSHSFTSSGQTPCCKAFRSSTRLANVELTETRKVLLFKDIIAPHFSQRARSRRGGASRAIPVGDLVEIFDPTNEFTM